MTNNLSKRVFQHKQGKVEGFTKKYNLHKLVYFETTNSVKAAITREKQIKGWIRAKKEALIEKANPNWEDLYLSLFD